MNKYWFYLGAMSSLAMMMTSCGGEGDNKPAPAPSPSATASPAAVAPAVAPTATTPTPVVTSPTTTTPPLVPAKSTATKSVSVDVAAGLIPPTDGDSWARTVAKGRPDPFATLSLQPIEAALPKDLLGQPIQPPQRATIAKTLRQSTTTANSPAIKSGVNQPLREGKIPDKIATKPAAKRGKSLVAIEPIKPDLTKVEVTSPKTQISQTAKPSVQKNTPKVAVVKNPSTTPLMQKPTVALKPITQPTLAIKPIALKPVPQPLKRSANPINTVVAKPEPKLATAVGVSGVIQVDGKTQVIVRLPNESFSRYVEVGDRIYDGKVKVKRVEGEQTLSPTVVLEEVGIEVNRRVGDVPGAADKEITKSEVQPSLP